MATVRHDYAFPFRIDVGSGRPETADYETHVRQMVLQLLLTSPGERANRPDFGCGLRALLFAGVSDSVAVTAEMLVRHSLGRWLSGHLEVRRVAVTSSDDGAVTVLVEYELLASRVHDRVEVAVR